MELTVLFTVLSYLLSTARSEHYDPSIECLNGIRTDISEFTFTGGDPEDYWGNICTNNLSVRSMWAAAKLYCTQHEINTGEKMLGGYCEEYGLVTLVPYSEILPILTDEFIAGLPVVEFDDINETKIWDHSVLLSEAFYTAGMRTTSTFQYEYILHQRYGWGVYGFWGGLLLIGIVNRFISHVLHSRRRAPAGDVEDSSPTTTSQASSSSLVSVFKSAHHWMRANLIIPAAFGSHHQRLLWWCTIPTRMETIVVVAFWILNLVLCCVSYEIFWPNLYYTKAIQTWRYVADRTGIICYANLPILWMFSGRNNIFLWLTGWSFSTFNIFHRHIARIATIQAVVHSIAYSALEANFGYFAESWTEKYWYMGGMATIAMSLLLGFSSIWIRKHTYEVFLLLHISMSVLVIVGLFYHTAIFDGEYDGYLWPLVAIWLFDRFARIARLLYCNLYVRFAGKTTTTKTTAVYDKDSDLIRLEVIPGSQLLKPGPGQHYFIYQRGKWNSWENHPFTLAAWSRVGDCAEASVPRADPVTAVNGIADKEVQVTAASTSSPESSSVASVSSQQEKVTDAHNTSEAKSTDLDGRTKLTFFIRPFTSWTKRLREECLKSPTGSIATGILIEGPYGERSPLHKYENVVFIVGGTGVSGALPYLQEHLRRLQDAPKSDAAATTLTRDITFVWATKQAAMIRDIASRELKPYLGREDMHFSFHATGRKEAALSSPSSPITTPEETESASEEADGGDKDIISAAAAVAGGTNLAIGYGRPNIHDTVMNVLEQVHAAGARRGGKIAILTCGPAAMADEARAAVHDALKKGKRGVEYIEETFGW